MRTIAAMIAAAALVAAVAAQTPTEEKPPAEKPPEGAVGGLRFLDVTEVTVVSIDVSVTDKKGNPIRGLVADDFEVFQDGKRQEISNFAFYSQQGPPVPEPTPTPAPVAAPTPVATPTPVPTPPPPPRDPRFLAIYVDNENIMPFNRNRVIKSLTDFARDYLQPPDKMMVVSYQRSLKTQQPFTSDPDEIASALRRLKTYVGGRNETNSSRREIEEYIERNSQESPDINRALGQVRAFAREQKNNLQFTVRSLQDMVQMMSGLPGKKSLIYVSDGLPMTPGLELFYEVQDTYREPSALTQSHDFDAVSLFRGLVTSAAASGVALYTIDARGLEAELGIEAENRYARSTMAASIARSNYQDSLLYMAEQTGGMAIVNTNDVGPGLARVAESLGTFYSIGYRLVPTGDDRLHRIKVKVKDHPEYNLAYREVFVEKSLSSKIADRVMTGLAFDLDDNPLQIEVITGEPAPASSGRWTLPVEVRVPYERIALLPDGSDIAGYLMVYYAARDDEGKQSDLQRREVPVRMPQREYERVRRGFFTINDSLLVEPGNYRVSIGVRDQLTNQAGYAAVRRAVHPELK